MSDRTILTVPSAPENVSKLEPFIDQAAERFNLTPDVHGSLLISLTEAVVNAIVHGNKNDSNKNVSIALVRNKHSLSVRVSDEGAGFDLNKVPNPTCPERIEECGGRGLFLMQNLADDCRFLKGGATVEMRFKL